MSSVLPFEIISLIIYFIGENEDTNLLKGLALSYSILSIFSSISAANISLPPEQPKERLYAVFYVVTRRNTASSLWCGVFQVTWHSPRNIEYSVPSLKK